MFRVNQFIPVQQQCVLTPSYHRCCSLSAFEASLKVLCNAFEASLLILSSRPFLFQMVTRTKKIFVGGLSANTVVEDVKQYFEQFGKVRQFHYYFSCKVLSHYPTFQLSLTQLQCTHDIYIIIKSDIC